MLRHLSKVDGDLKDEDLVEGVQRGTMMILANWVKESDRIVTF